MCGLSIKGIILPLLAAMIIILGNTGIAKASPFDFSTPLATTPASDEWGDVITVEKVCTVNLGGAKYNKMLEELREIITGDVIGMDNIYMVGLINPNYYIIDSGIKTYAETYVLTNCTKLNEPSGKIRIASDSTQIRGQKITSDVLARIIDEIYAISVEMDADPKECVRKYLQGLTEGDTLVIPGYQKTKTRHIAVKISYGAFTDEFSPTHTKLARFPEIGKLVGFRIGEDAVTVKIDGEWYPLFIQDWERMLERCIDSTYDIDKCETEYHQRIVRLFFSKYRDPKTAGELLYGRFLSKPEYGIPILSFDDQNVPYSVEEVFVTKVKGTHGCSIVFGDGPGRLKLSCPNNTCYYPKVEKHMKMICEGKEGPFEVKPINVADILVHSIPSIIREDTNTGTVYVSFPLWGKINRFGMTVNGKKLVLATEETTQTAFIGTLEGKTNVFSSSSEILWEGMDREMVLGSIDGRYVSFISALTLCPLRIEANVVDLGNPKVHIGKKILVFRGGSFNKKHVDAYIRSLKREGFSVRECGVTKWGIGHIVSCNGETVQPSQAVPYGLASIKAQIYSTYLKYKPDYIVFIGTQGDIPTGYDTRLSIAVPYLDEDGEVRIAYPGYYAAIDWEDYPDPEVKAALELASILAKNGGITPEEIKEVLEEHGTTAEKYREFIRNAEGALNLKLAGDDILVDFDGDGYPDVPHYRIDTEYALDAAARTEIEGNSITLVTDICGDEGFCFITEYTEALKEYVPVDKTYEMPPFCQTAETYLYWEDDEGAKSVINTLIKRISGDGQEIDRLPPLGYLEIPCAEPPATTGIYREPIVIIHAHGFLDELGGVAPITKILPEAKDHNVGGVISTNWVPALDSVSDEDINPGVAILLSCISATPEYDDLDSIHRALIMNGFSGVVANTREIVVPTIPFPSSGESAILNVIILETQYLLKGYDLATANYLAKKVVSMLPESVSRDPRMIADSIAHEVFGAGTARIISTADTQT